VFQAPKLRKIATPAEADHRVADMFDRLDYPLQIIHSQKNSAPQLQRAPGRPCCRKRRSNPLEILNKKREVDAKASQYCGASFTLWRRRILW
jgi:hypothetical protein